MGPRRERECVSSACDLGPWLTSSAFSSFPDTSLFNEGSIQFSFKIRELQPDPSSLALPEPPSPVVGTSALPMAEGTKRAKAEEYRAWNERGREWLYGFVWFQQRRDRGIARGYMQVRRFRLERTDPAEISRDSHSPPLPKALRQRSGPCCSQLLQVWILRP